jgi:hypothetical protein
MEGVFDGLTIANFTSSGEVDWGALVCLAGATLANPAEAANLLAHSMEAGGGAREANGVLAIADPNDQKWSEELRSWRDEMLKVHGGKEGATRALYGERVPGEQGCLCIVSVEWVAQSLAAGVKLRLNESPLFSLFRDSAESYFRSEESGVPERYTLGDMVQYNTEERRCLGKISSFSHEGRICKVMHVHEERDGGDGNGNGNGDDSGGRRVTLDPDGRCTLISTDKLLCKALVLAEEAYSRLRYPGAEERIYCASYEWADAEEEMEADFRRRYFPEPQHDPLSTDQEEVDYSFGQTQGDW